MTTRKKLGFFTRLLDRASAAERYRLATEQIVEAERCGVDNAWIAQHHFHADEGGLPSPFVFLAHVAAKTSRIRLGTGVVTLPMENAVRVAEDAVVLDLLSGGRLEFGVGSGGTPNTFLAFGETSAERGPAMARNLALVRDAWAGRPLGSPDNVLYPAAGSLNDRVWQATFSVEGGRRAGEAGDGLMLSRTQPRPKGSPRASLDEIQNPIIDAYLAALPPGRAPRIMASRTLFVAESRDHALRLAEKGLRGSIDHFAATGFPPLGDRLEDIIATYDAHIGSPEDAIASLKADTALLRATDLAFQVHSVDPPHADILRSIRLVASHVAPALGWRPAFERTADIKEQAL
ncbi:MAG: putative FMN-dependent luciferase-like monooxygenase [Hyphomicrobiales bacterium]|nr:putative FMN-dependent luciferase-like monooxygenase [Hyphomicrobiales bacterium]MBV8661834.1 putative FMN-dependent luciferase-like monooxygenase [Hyphomicrobiales bacterium]